MKLGRLAGGLTLAAVSTVVCLLAIEGVARLAEEIRARSAVRHLRTDPSTRFHPVLGWEKVPNHEQRVQTPDFDVIFKTNSHGLRGPEVAYAKPPGTRRVLLLGDSFTEGFYVNEAATLRAVLERALDATGQGRCEVINGGTSAYSTDQEYLLYKLDGYRYDADVVVLLFYYNDLLNNVLPSDDGTAKPLFVLDHDKLELRNVPLPKPAADDPKAPWARVRRLKPWRGSIALQMLSRRTTTSTPRLHDMLAHLGLVPKSRRAMPREMSVFGPAPDVAVMWRMTRALLRDLDGEVRAHGAHLLVLYVPAVFEVDERAWLRWRQAYRADGSWSRDSVVDHLGKVCARLGITLVDARDALRAAQATGSPAYFSIDPHWTEVGNRIAAEAVAPAVRSVLTQAHRR
jgi:hypothetical protein